jgi:hypothetical protein
MTSTCCALFWIGWPEALTDHTGIESKPLRPIQRKGVTIQHVQISINRQANSSHVQHTFNNCKFVHDRYCRQLSASRCLRPRKSKKELEFRYYSLMFYSRNNSCRLRRNVKPHDQGSLFSLHSVNQPYNPDFHHGTRDPRASLFYV